MGNSNSYHAYSDEKKRWHRLIRSAIVEMPEKPFDKAEVEIIYYFKDKRRHDPDNYSGKFIMDGLVQEGILADDSFAVIENLKLVGKYDKSNPRTVIVVTGV